MIDEAAMNTMLDGTGWSVAVTLDDSVGGSVIIVDEPKVDADGAPVLDADGVQETEPVHYHVGLDEPAYVLVARRDDDLLRLSPTMTAEEVLLSLWDHDTEREIHAAHDRGEHGDVETRTAGCQRCWEQVWAHDAAKAHHDSLFGSRPADLVAWIKARVQ